MSASTYSSLALSRSSVDFSCALRTASEFMIVAFTDSKDGGSCAVFLQVPSLGIAVTLHPGENVIDLPALQSGRIQNMCSMGMYGFTINFK